jgi:hypothetical protein
MYIGKKENATAFFHVSGKNTGNLYGNATGSIVSFCNRGYCTYRRHCCILYGIFRMPRQFNLVQILIHADGIGAGKALRASNS